MALVSRRHHWSRLFAGMFTFLALIGVAARLLPSDVQALPYVPAVIAFTPWLVVPALLGLIFALVSKRWIVALLALGCLVTVAWWQYPFFHADAEISSQAKQAVAARSVNTTDGYARVMTFNVYKGRADPAAIVKLVRDQHVEVLALEETTDSFVAALHDAGIEDVLPYSHVSSADGKFGNGLWSATPLGDPSDDDVDSVASLMPGGTVSFDGGATAVRFVAVHTTAPVSGYWHEWKQSLDEVARMRSHANVNYVLMGDFNATLDHAPMRGVLGERFTDAAEQAGRGLTLTWPQDRRPWLPPFCGIDHVVIDQGMTAGQVEVKHIAGSDHGALLATIDVSNR